MSMSKKTYDHRDLVRTYVLAKSYEKAAPELRDYYGGLYSGLSSFFGADLDQIGSISDAESDSFGMDHLFNRCLEQYLRVSSPFGEFIEAPRRICDLYEKYGKRLTEIENNYKAACFDLMCEICRIVFGATDKQITSDELKRLGFDDSEEPDELDFF
jgi:hypothetical protein